MDIRAMVPTIHVYETVSVYLAVSTNCSAEDLFRQYWYSIYGDDRNVAVLAPLS